MGEIDSDFELAHSSDWTGGAVLAAGAGGGAAGGGLLAALPEVATRALVVAWAAGLDPPLVTSALAPRTPSCEACLRFRDERDRSIPQERAIEGPAE